MSNDDDQTPYRVRFPDGKYLKGGTYGVTTKRGKTWVGKGHLNQLLGSFGYFYSRANGHDRNPNNWTVFSEGTHIAKQFHGVVIVNQITGAEENFIDVLDTYMRHCYKKKARK